ncbi:MAG: hypothetical protein QXM68_03720 [Candidatus Aenigmatarchaeota archaeon]|nr:hypothetical protein [Candidatus Aenigmarchaeota archaeon]
MNFVNKTVKGINKIKKERDEWMKKYQDLVNHYATSIQTAINEAKNAENIVKDDKKEHEKIQQRLDEISSFVEDFYKTASKKIEQIEKFDKELDYSKKEIFSKLETQVKVNEDMHYDIRLLKERIKKIEEIQDRQEKLIKEMNDSIKEFKNYVVLHINSANIEYEKRFEKFKERYEDSMQISNELRRDAKKLNSFAQILENFHKRIKNIELKIDKIENMLSANEKRIDIVRREKEVINDRIYDVKEDISLKLKEIEDLVYMLEEDIKEIKKSR